MMDEPEVWKDKSWTDDWDTQSCPRAPSRLKQQPHLVEKSVTASLLYSPVLELIHDLSQKFELTVFTNKELEVLYYRNVS